MAEKISVRGDIKQEICRAKIVCVLVFGGIKPKSKYSLEETHYNLDLYRLEI